jgi:hypothetical protein
VRVISLGRLDRGTYYNSRHGSVRLFRIHGSHSSRAILRNMVRQMAGSFARAGLFAQYEKPRLVGKLGATIPFT